MRSAFVGAEVTGWEPLEGNYSLPDPDDEHVVAAAHLSGAGAIVTDNLKDFPSAQVPEGIDVLPPHEFARDAVQLGSGRALLAITEIASRSGRYGPRRGPLEVIEVLEQRYRMIDAMAMVREELVALGP